MLGDSVNPGLVPRICNALFEAITARSGNDVEFQLTLSMMEIYNERAFDLLSSGEQLTECRVRQHPKQGFFVEGIAKIPVTAYRDIAARMNHGMRLRTTAATNMNKTSSRSHMILSLSLKQVSVLHRTFPTVSCHCATGLCERRWRKHHQDVRHTPGGLGW